MYLLVASTNEMHIHEYKQQQQQLQLLVYVYEGFSIESVRFFLERNHVSAINTDWLTDSLLKLCDPDWIEFRSKYWLASSYKAEKLFLEIEL